MLTGQKVEWWVPGPGERGQWEVSVNGYSVSILRDDEKSSLDAAMAAQQCEYTSR